MRRVPGQIVALFIAFCVIIFTMVMTPLAAAEPTTGPSHRPPAKSSKPKPEPDHRRTTAPKQAEHPLAATQGQQLRAGVAKAADSAVTSLAVSPHTVSLKDGKDRQLNVVATYADGSKADVTKKASFGTASGKIATVSDAGMITSQKPGTTTLTAIYRGLRSEPTPAMVTAAALDSISVKPAGADLGVGDSQKFTATGRFADGSTKPLPDAVWGSTKPSVAGIDATGTVSALSPGTASVFATFSGVVSAGNAVNVDGSRPTAIQLTPATSSVPKGGTQQYTATASYPDGHTADVTTEADWASSSTDIATIDPAGLATALKAGKSTISAAFAGRTATSTLTVESAALTGVTVAPVTASVARGATTQLTAVAVYSDHSTVDVTATAAWQSDSANAAVSSSGLVTGQSEGTALVSASFGGRMGGATITVTAPALTGIQVTPPTAKLNAGRVQQLTATANYGDATTADITKQATWTSSSSTTATVDAAGVVTAKKAGSATVTATFNGRTATTAITVTAATVDSVSVTPSLAQKLAIGAKLVMTANAKLSDNSSIDITGQASWVSSNPSVATIGSTGQVTAVKAGTTAITATYGGASSASVSITVQGKALVSLAVTPTSASLAAGASKTFTATGVYSDNTTADLTQSVAWSSSAADVVAVDAVGQATGVKTGAATIRATIDDQTATATVTVTAATLSSVQVTPAAGASIKVGGQQQFTATAVYSDQSKLNVSSQATWTSGTPSVATISGTGLATAVAAGSTAIKAAFNGKTSGAVTLGVTKSAITSLDINPKDSNWPVSSGPRMKLTATYADGSTAEVPANQVSWTSTNPSVADLQASTGYVYSKSVGQTTITGTVGSLSASTTYNVRAVLTLNLKPIKINTTIGGSSKITASATLVDAGSIYVTPSWQVADPTVATIATDGTVTGLAEGSTTITGTFNGVSATVDVVVAGSKLTAITVTGTAEVPDGTQSQLVATGSYLNGTSKDITASATWTSSNSSVATVTAKGMVTGVAAGTATITAAQGDVTSATFTINVTQRAVQSLQITPSGAKFGIGDRQQYTATATFADGTTSDITSGATWSTSNTKLATITTAGRATGVAAGAVSIKATFRTKPATAPATVGATATDRMQRAIDQGDPNLVSQQELLKQVPLSLAKRTYLGNDLIPDDGATITWEPNPNGYYVKTPGSGMQPILTGNTNLKGGTDPNRTLAAVGYGNGSLTRMAYFGANPFVNDDGGRYSSWKPMSDPGMVGIDKNTVGWLLGATSFDPTTTDAHIVLAGAKDSSEGYALQSLAQQFPKAVINNGSTTKNACDFTATSDCLDGADLLIIGDNASTANQATVDAVLAAYRKGLPLLIMGENGNSTPDSSAVAKALGLVTGQNYWQHNAILNSTKAQQIPSGSIDDQFGRDATEIDSRLGNGPLQPSDYSACLAADGDSLSGTTFDKCVASPPAGLSDAAKSYFAALARMKTVVTGLDTTATDIFAASGSDQNETLRVLAMLADKQRTGAEPSSRADDDAKAISYPVDVRGDGKAVTHALFADWFTPTAWAGNQPAADLGSLWCASQTAIENDTCTAPKFPGRGDHKLTLTSSARDEYTATGLDLVPGAPSTVTVTNSPDIPVYVRTFAVKPGDGRSAEFTKDGVSRYIRPQYASTDWIRLLPGTPTTISSPYGGPLYIRMDADAKTSNTPVDLSFTDVGKHPTVFNMNDTAQLKDVADDLTATTAYYTDLVGTGFEVHVPVTKLRAALSSDGLEEAGRTHYYDDAHGGMTKLLLDFRDAWFNSSFLLAGLKVPGKTLDQSLPTDVKQACSSFKFPCTDASVNSSDEVQHVVYDVASSCGAACSGNPITLGTAVDPMDWTLHHELGHNLQRTQLNTYWVDTGNGANADKINNWANYVKRSGEQSNEIFPYWDQWKYWRVSEPDRLGTGPDTGKLTIDDPRMYLDLYAQHQSAYSGLTQDGKKVVLTGACKIKNSYPTSATPASMLADSVWGDASSNYADSGIRESFYDELPVVLENKKLADGTTLDHGTDIITLLYGAARGYTSAAASESSWNDNRATYGFSQYPYSGSPTYGGATIKDMPGNDFLLVELSKITGYDFRPYFAEHGVYYTDLADKQVTANAPSAGYQKLSQPIPVLGNQYPLRDLSGTPTIDLTDPTTIWPGTDDNADGTPETKIKFHPSQCPGVSSPADAGAQNGKGPSATTEPNAPTGSRIDTPSAAGTTRQSSQR